MGFKILAKYNYEITTKFPSSVKLSIKGGICCNKGTHIEEVAKFCNKYKFTEGEAARRVGTPFAVLRIATALINIVIFHCVRD